MTDHDIVILQTGQRFPEGPAFDKKGTLWWSEIEAGGVACRTTAGSVSRYPLGGKPNGLAIDALGAVYFCDGEGGLVGHFDPAGGDRGVVASGRAAPNDLAFDALGNLIFTCPGDSRKEPTGYVACVSPDGYCTIVGSGLYFPNGLAFTDDGATLIVAETYRGRLVSGAWDAERRRWIDPAPFCSTSPSPNGPDGLAIGQDGDIYVAVYGASCIDVFDERGRTIGRIEVPGAKPTNCAFDPSGRLGLIVTEAERGNVLSLPGLGSGQPLFGRSIAVGGP